MGRKKTEERPPNEPHAAVKFWLGEIAASRKREKDFRKNGREVREIYSGDKPECVPFNILYSNVETLLPALFSQSPRPVVQRRFKDEDPLGKAASTAATRMLEYLTDTNVEGYETLEQSMTAATLDALLPGRGVTGIKYDAEVTTPEEGSDSPATLVWEQVCTDSRKWDAVHFGFARKWSKVPWIAYEEYVDQEEAERLFGKEIAGKIQYSADEQAEEDEDDDVSDSTDSDDDEGSRKVALVYQIWDRAGGKKLRYVSPQYIEGYLKEDDDPYGITGFFNCPKPLQFLVKTGDMLPVAPYQLYRNQAEELNELTRRINKVTKALKVRGAYDGALGSVIADILKGEDNEMVATDDGATLTSQGGLDRAIWLMPIEKLIAVLQQLVMAREACKRVIYEITGVSDIVRGQSIASETLGAQKIKEAWGTMRLKRLQKETQRYARDTLRIMLEVAASKLSVKTWAQATGLPFVTSEQKKMAQQIAKAAQMQGIPPDPQAIKDLQSPVWDDVLALLKNDVQRAYRIDIETNSTIDVEATEDQKNISEVMQAVAQFLHGIGPLVENGTMPFGAAQAMLLTIVRRFRFGTEVEDQIKNMAPPKPKDDGKETQAAMAELQQKHASEQAQMQQEAAQTQMQLRFDAQLEAAKLAAEKELAILSEREESDRKMAELQQKHTSELAKQESTRVIEQMKASMARDTALKIAMIEAEKARDVARISAIGKVEDTEETTEDDSEETNELAPVLDALQQIMEQLTAPKEIKRGPDGRAVSVGGRMVLRGPDGRATGLQ